jgi:hypothetical protein
VFPTGSFLLGGYLNFLLAKTRSKANGSAAAAAAAAAATYVVLVSWFFLLRSELAI